MASNSPGQPAAAAAKMDDPAYANDMALTARIRTFLQQVDPSTAYSED
jgi:hypothetical protein